MNSREALKSAMNLGQMLLQTYVGDLDDADLLRRPAVGCNHLAWQLGHLISAEAFLLEGIFPGRAAALPAGFAEQHSKETAGVDDPTRFRNKQEYLELFGKVRAVTLQALEATSDAALDAPAPERLRKNFPTVGDVYSLIGAHPTMHAGQFVVVRRLLGKPVLI